MNCATGCVRDRPMPMFQGLPVKTSISRSIPTSLLPDARVSFGFHSVCCEAVGAAPRRDLPICGVIAARAPFLQRNFDSSPARYQTVTIRY